jgi:hypothetical protein
MCYNKIVYVRLIPIQLRACLVELHAAPDPRNSSTPNFLRQTHPTPAAPPWICSRKKVEQTPNSMVFMECLKRYSTKSNFVELV